MSEGTITNRWEISLHKTTFTQEEIDRLKELIQEKQNTVGKSGQKRIRDKMRTIGFYISDFPGSRDFGVSDFRLLLRKGLIKVIDEAKAPLTNPRASHILKHDNLWEWCQNKSDMLLSYGLKQLNASKVFPWGSGYVDGPGVYLFIEGSKKLYIGESLSIPKRLKQHCEGGVRSTFLKNYAEEIHGSKEMWAIQDTLAHSKENVQLQSLWVDIARKELEEFGMVNFPTVLNKFHKGKRDRYRTDSQDDDLWDNIQNQAIDIIKEGAKIVKDLSPKPWINGNP